MLVLIMGCARPAMVPPAPITSVSEDGLPAELVVSGSLSERVRSDDASLVIYYGGEERGSLEPCGCPVLPRGGLARQAAYISAARQASPSAGHLVVNGGYWLEDAVGLNGQPRADTPVMNRWMSAGLSALGVDVLNVGYPDMAGLRSLGGAPSGLPLVSANLVGAGIATSRVVVTGGLRVGVTGISTEGSRVLATPGFEVTDPVRAGREVLESLAATSDVTVLLAYQAPEAARRLARSGLVDVVIDVQQHRERYAPIQVGGAVWVRSHYQTMRLGELRLDIEDGVVTGVLDRKIDLDPEVPSSPEVLSVVRSARAALDAVQRELYGR
ncbi:MAG: hypothetical protein ACI8S6_000768 [Myxococcota bacterium]|jgi:hypothetical protein